MKLFDGGRAPNPRRVRVFLAEKGIDVPLHPVDMGALGPMRWRDGEALSEDETRRLLALLREAERAAKLIAKDSRVTDLDNRHRAIERAVEHRYLQLGIAFRKAVSALLAERA